VGRQAIPDGGMRFVIMSCTSIRAACWPAPGAGVAWRKRRVGRRRSPRVRSARQPQEN